MSSKEKTPKSKSKVKKERKKKRQATSPLFESGHTQASGVNTGEQKNNQRKKCKADDIAQTVSDFYSNFGLVYDSNMSFQAQGAQFGMPQSQPFNQQQAYMQSPPPTGQMGFGLPPSAVPPSAPPPWATKLLEEVANIKEKLQCMDEIKQTVNSINAKVITLETKMNDMDTRLATNEKACDFVAKKFENNKTEMKAAKDVCKEVLKLTDADRILFDRVHRVGTRTGHKARPIVAKFHYYHERETVRKRAFDYGEALKQVNKGIGAQLPKQLRDERKPLYPAMKKAKEEGKKVRFVGNKLYIEDEEYVEPTPMDR